MIRLPKDLTVLYRLRDASLINYRDREHLMVDVAADLAAEIRYWALSEAEWDDLKDFVYFATWFMVWSRWQTI